MVSPVFLSSATMVVLFPQGVKITLSSTISIDSEIPHAPKLEPNLPETSNPHSLFPSFA
jgi:hypothetical protein